MATPLIFVVIQIEREIVMTAWRLHWEPRESDQYFVICCLLFVIRMLRLSIVSIYVVIMHFFFAFPLCLIIVVSICGLYYEWVRSRFVYSFAHIHMHFHDIHMHSHAMAS